MVSPFLLDLRGFVSLCVPRFLIDEFFSRGDAEARMFGREIGDGQENPMVRPKGRQFISPAQCAGRLNAPAKTSSHILPDQFHP
jgi:hypothetical protein